MLELAEAFTIACQINETIRGKRIAGVVAAHTPHKFAWYYNDALDYNQLLINNTIDKARGIGGLVEIQAGSAIILVGDGTRLTFHDKNQKRPQKHQLLLEFEDGSALSASVQMYGGIWAFPQGELENPYYEVAQEKPSPLSNDFDWEYFERMLSDVEVPKLSAKVFLATKQRIPGLGNGVLQDILYNAGIHPKRKVSTFSDDERKKLYNSIKGTLTEMSNQGGRDTEKDLFNQLGGYITKLSKNTAGKPCPKCNGTIIKENYLGGSIYYCNGCQHLD